MIIITGASDGLGKEVAELYKNSNETVVNISRTKSDVVDINIGCDLSNDSAIEDAVKQVIELNEELSVLINCAGVWGEQSLENMTTKETEVLLSVNLKAPMILVSKLISKIKADGTDIVNIISTAGLWGNKNHMAYAASKWGIRGFTEALRSELKPTKSRVISFYPGGMKTKFFEKNLGDDITEDGSYWMNPKDVALCIKQILDLPKNIEVSEITLNRKKTL